MRVVFAGGAWLGSASLRALLGSGHDVVGILDPGLKRSLSMRYADRDWEYLLIKARLRGAAVITLSDVPWAVAALGRLGADVLLSCGFPRRIPMSLLRVPRLGGINIHPSMLPRYRGADPCYSAILAGDTTTGITFHGMEEGFDTGPIFRQVEIDLQDTTTRGELVDRSAHTAAEQVIPFLDDLEQGRVHPAVQEERAASACGKITDATGLIDWRKSAVEIMRQYRAHAPDNYLWFRYADRRVYVLTLKHVTCEIAASPGIVVSVRPRLVIATGEGHLALEAAMVFSPIPRPWPTRWDGVGAGTELTGGIGEKT